MDAVTTKVGTRTGATIRRGDKETRRQGGRTRRAGLLVWLFSFLVLVPLTASGQEKKQGKKDDKAKAGLTARCDRDNAIYHVGERAKFLLSRDTPGEAVYRLTEDGVGTITEGKVQFQPGEGYSLTGTLSKPGFLQLRVNNKAVAAAAFDPTKIEPTARVPSDFDDFWEASKKELAAVPMDPQLVKSDMNSTDLVTCYKISLANVGGKRVHGWLSVPRGKGPFPAILTLPGAGVSAIGPDRDHAKLGALSMNIIIHDLPVDETKEFYKNQAAGPLKDYRDIGWDDRDKNYYRAVILGCIRSIDYLVSRPDFNGRDLGVTGGSQGGGLTLITSGLDPRVTLAAPAIAALCEHSGKAFGRISGWPHWLARAPEDKAARILDTSGYYDAVNFARKFKGKSLHAVGFIDEVCAPTTVCAAFNVHPEPKTMIASPLLGHNIDKRWISARVDFWKKNMKLVPPDKPDKQ
jgi:cephalosporin-C deacetylase-like acetyl esterase